MALPREYSTQDCAIARTLEVVGERWTMLIVRDAFYGVRRFSDFQTHLGMSKSVLADRLAGLVEHGILQQLPGPHGRDEYELTAKGQKLWPVLRSLFDWGNDHCTAPSSRRLYTHAECGGTVGADHRCAECGATPDIEDLVLQPQPTPRTVDDPIGVALTRPHRLLEPFTP